MLVLSRRVGEEIVIADEIKIRVVRCAGNRVTIGIEAPPHISIQRKELLEQLLVEAGSAKGERKTA